jgi:hypothetical protein
VAAAQDVANQNQLLLGDEANWSDFAARRLASSPPTARAFFASLVLQGKTRATREAAQLQLVHALQSSSLALTALRLFNDTARFPTGSTRSPGALSAGRHRRGERPAGARLGRYWLGLNTPPGIEAEEWQLRLAQVLIRAGAAGPAAEALHALIAGSKSQPASRMQRAVSAVQQLQDAGYSKPAEELYRALLPQARVPERREILFGLGRIAAGDNDFRRAADYFLEAALLGDARTPDALAVNARLQAASNLMRAGLKADARAQLAWLQKNVEDAEKLELVRREMLKL